MCERGSKQTPDLRILPRPPVLKFLLRHILFVISLQFFDAVKSDYELFSSYWQFFNTTWHSCSVSGPGAIILRRAYLLFKSHFYIFLAKNETWIKVSSFKYYGTGAWLKWMKINRLQALRTTHKMKHYVNC